MESAGPGTVSARTPVRSDPSMIGDHTRVPFGSFRDHCGPIDERASRHRSHDGLLLRQIGVRTPVRYRLEHRLREVDQIHHDVSHAQRRRSPKHDARHRLRSCLSSPHRGTEIETNHCAR